MSDFHYSDPGEVLTIQLIRDDYDPEYWGRSEDRVLKQAEDYLRFRYGDKLKEARLLDLGCGEGRLIPRFAAQTGHVTALEPDPDRCRKAAELVERERIPNATVLNMTSGEYLKQFPDAGFDVVLCSHVFQHIGQEILEGILEDIRNLTAKQAVCIFLTTYTSKAENVYTAERLVDGKRQVEYTDLQGFEKAVAERDTLAVTLFSQTDLEERMTRHGLHRAAFHPFHFKDTSDETRDDENPNRENARDALYVCTKGVFDYPGRTPGCGPDTLEGKMCFMLYYDLKPDEKKRKKKGEAEAIEKKRKALEDGEKIGDDVRSATGFLYAEGVPFGLKRYYKTGLDTKIVGKDCPVRESHAIVTIIPSRNLAQVSFNVALGESVTDNYLYLRQSGFGDRFFTIEGKETGLKDYAKTLLEDELEYELESDKPLNTASIMEINRFGDRIDCKDLCMEETRCLYGLLTGDEGYRFVSEDRIHSMMRKHWGSRDFFEVLAFKTNYLLLNLNQGSRYQDEYLGTQSPYQDHYYGGMNHYFVMDADTAGVNHGLFFSVERGMCILSDIERMLEKVPKSTKDWWIRRALKKNAKYRMELIEILNSIKLGSFAEIGELDKLIADNLELGRRTEMMRYLLENVEAELEMLYDRRSNRGMTVLTVLGLLLAALQVAGLIWELTH